MCIKGAKKNGDTSFSLNHRMERKDEWREKDMENEERSLHIFYFLDHHHSLLFLSFLLLRIIFSSFHFQIFPFIPSSLSSPIFRISILLSHPLQWAAPFILSFSLIIPSFLFLTTCLTMRERALLQWFERRGKKEKYGLTDRRHRHKRERKVEKIELIPSFFMIKEKTEKRTEQNPRIERGVFPQKDVV